MNRKPDRTVPRHPIGVVCRRTGLKPDVVRAWERRYGAVKPGRSSGEQRLFSDNDLERLILLRRLTLDGRSIGQIARLDDDELQRLVALDQRTAVPPNPSHPASEADGALTHLAEECLDAIRRIDPEAMQRVLERASSVLGRRQLFENLLAPVLDRVGWLWQDGRIRPVHEHLAITVIKSFTYDVLRDARPQPGQPAIVTGTPPGQAHELGAMFTAALACGEGWSATYLGPGLPADDLALAANERDARVVAVGITCPDDDAQMVSELRSLKRQIGRSRILVVGGRAADAHATLLAEIGAIHALRLADVRDVLRSSRPEESRDLTTS